MIASSVVLILEDAAVVLLLKAGGHLAHLHGAALAAGARQDVVVVEVDELYLAHLPPAGARAPP
jgi:hypothetical protein